MNLLVARGREDFAEGHARLEAFLAGEFFGAHHFGLFDDRLGIAARGGDVCHRALAFYLADMEQRRLHRTLGYSNAVDFATDRLGLTRSRAYELLAAGRRLEKLPALDEAFATDVPVVLSLPIDYRENPALTARLGNIACPI